MSSAEKTPDKKVSSNANSSPMNTTVSTAVSSNNKSMFLPESSSQVLVELKCHSKNDFSDPEEAERCIMKLCDIYNKKMPLKDLSDEEYDIVIDASSFFKDEYNEFEDYYVEEFSNVDFINYFLSFYVEYNYPEEMQAFLCICLYTLSCKYEVITTQSEEELMLNFKYLVNYYQFKNQNDKFNPEEDLDDLEVELQKFMKNNYNTVCNYFDKYPDLKEYYEIDEL